MKFALGFVLGVVALDVLVSYVVRDEKGWPQFRDAIEAKYHSNPAGQFAVDADSWIELLRNSPYGVED